MPLANASVCLCTLPSPHHLYVHTRRQFLPSITRQRYQHLASTMYYVDDWPRKGDGNEYGDDELIALLRSGGNPFKEQWDLQQLTNEVEQHVNTRVVGIQDFAKGSNNYVRRAGLIAMILEANAHPGNPPPDLRRTRSLVSPCERRCQLSRLPRLPH